MIWISPIIEVMIPFVRTIAEAKSVVDILKEHGLK